MRAAAAALEFEEAARLRDEVKRLEQMELDGLSGQIKPDGKVKAGTAADVKQRREEAARPKKPRGTPEVITPDMLNGPPRRGRSSGGTPGSRASRGRRRR